MTGRQEGGAWRLQGEANRAQTGELSWQEQGLSHSGALLPQEASVHQKPMLAWGTASSKQGQQESLGLSLESLDNRQSGYAAICPPVPSPVLLSPAIILM